MPDSHFSPFGRLLVPLDALSLDERVRILLADLGSWKYGTCNPVVGAWFAAGVDRFLRHGGDLARHLQLRPPRGSRATAQRIERLRERDTLLVQLTVTLGSAARARRVLDGDEACPARARPLLEALQAHAIPRSKAAFTRAKKVSRLRR